MACGAILPQATYGANQESLYFPHNSQACDWLGDCKERRRLQAGDRVAHDEEMRRRCIERDVLAYVLERPAAKDTAEGVRHWWLKNGAGLTGRDVRVVLSALAVKGWLAVRGMQGESGEDALVYELNTSCTDEIRRHLAVLRAAEEPGLPGSPEMPEGRPRG
jgi:hypothetical protein